MNEHREETKRRSENGIYVPDRVPGAAESQSSGSAVAEAARIARGSHLSTETASTPEFAREVTFAKQKAGYFATNRIVRPLEKAGLRVWAESKGLMLDDSKFEKEWKKDGQQQGAEHDVYFNPEQQRWFKRNNLSNHGNYLEYFHRLQLHNYRFQEAPVRFEGFVEYEGELLPVTSQEHIEAERGASREEVRLLMEQLGFMPVDDPTRPNDYVNTATGEEVNDLHDENAVIDRDGNVSIFDPVPRMLWESKANRVATL